ncbi:MAG TPA: ComEC/Rec2 family competence protein, partial [Pseudoneobacillus sp.]|nr:ComEC/Rec2 family competence protein [Pseudoneobacillus sp.]
MKEKLVFATLSALLGIISAFEGIWILVIFLLFLYGLWSIKKVNNKLILLFTLFYVFYYFASDLSIKQNTSTLPPLKTQFLVQFSDEVKIDGDRLRAIVSDLETKEKMVLTYKIPTQMLKEQLINTSLLKNICSISGELETPGLSRNLNSFNYRKYLKQKHIFWELNVTSWNISSCTRSRFTMLDHLKMMRINGISEIEKNFPKELAPIAAALIFGTRELLTEETLTAYQRLGVIHLISISGLHVALLVSLIFYIGIRLGAIKEKLSKILIVVLPFYAIITGATPSVNRAVIMAVLILITTNFQSLYQLKSVDGLCFSFLLLTITNPYMIYNIGFQLSFIVTFALLLSTFILSNYSSSLSKLVFTSYISQVAALPLLLYHFFEIPLLSILANLLYIPLYSFIFLPGLLFLFIIQFISMDVFHFFAFFLTLLADNSSRLAEYISAFSWTRLVPGRPSLLFTSFYVISIFISFYSWDRGRQSRIYLSLPWLVLSLQLLLPNIYSEGAVTFIDVGQG